MKKVGTALGPATGPLGPWWSHLFQKTASGAFCHLWLSCLLVTPG